MESTLSGGPDATWKALCQVDVESPLSGGPDHDVTWKALCQVDLIIKSSRTIHVSGSRLVNIYSCQYIRFL